jgi:hypothetical protein
MIPPVRKHLCHLAAQFSQHVQMQDRKAILDLYGNASSCAIRETNPQASTK